MTTRKELADLLGVDVKTLRPEEIADCDSTLTDKANDAWDEVQARSRSGVERLWTQAELCRDYLYIGPIKRFVLRADPELAYDITGFDARFGYANRKGKLSKALFERAHHTIRRLDGVVYQPNAPEFTDDNRWNGWRPSPVVAAEGDTTLFHQHIEYLFPDVKDQNHLLNWMAAVLQHPETKPRHQLVLRGPIQGTGKTFFARLMRKLIGASNCQMLTQDILENGFTGWAMHTKFVWIEEVRNLTNSKSATSKLHSWASEGTITVNQKNLPTFVMEQVIAFIIMSNKDDALALDDSDRRYLMLKTDAVIHPDGSAHYDKLYGVNNVGGVLGDPIALGAILHELLHRDLGDYSIEQAAPFTAAKAETIEAGASEVAEYLHNNDCIGDRRVVRVDDIIECLPGRLQVRGAAKAVREFLKAPHRHCKQWPDQIRLDGDKIRVWIIGNPKSKSGGKLTAAIVAGMYRADSDKGEGRVC